MMICIVCLLFPIQQYDKTYGARNSTTRIRKVTYYIITFFDERLSNLPIFLYHNRFQKYHIFGYTSRDLFRFPRFGAVSLQQQSEISTGGEMSTKKVDTDRRGPVRLQQQVKRHKRSVTRIP